MPCGWKKETLTLANGEWVLETEIRDAVMVDNKTLLSQRQQTSAAVTWLLAKCFFIISPFNTSLC